MEERNNINKFRKKRSYRKLLWSLIALLAVFTVVMVVVVNWGKIVAPLKDVALDVGEGGFPVELPGSAGYTFDRLGDNFYLLTDTYIYTYNDEGAAITDIQHGFQNPVSAANDKRVVVYDKNGKSFNLYSRMEEVYKNTLEDSIVFAEISNGERCAVVTTSTRYSNYLYVFNGDGKQIFRWASPDYKIMQVEFSDNDNSIYVAALGSEDGNLQQYVIRFDLDNAQSSVWNTYIGDEISYKLMCCNDGVFVITSGGCKLLDIGTGEVLSESSFDKSISAIPDADNGRAVMFRDPASSGDVLTVYGKELEAQTLYIDSFTSVTENSGVYYVLAGSELYSYNSALQPLKTYELDDVYSDMTVIGQNVYLLGYNVVQRLAL